jgi:hypothetical protein
MKNFSKKKRLMPFLENEPKSHVIVIYMTWREVLAKEGGSPTPYHLGA